MLKNRVKELRQEKNLTLRELADKVGMDHSAISRIENNGRNLSDYDIVTFCNFFNVSSDYLLNLSDVRKTINSNQIVAGTQASLFDATKDLTLEQQNQIIDFINFIKKKST